MNRRAFFGFATGGVMAAPLALVGKRPSEQTAPPRMAILGHRGPEIVNLPTHKITVSAEMDDRIRQRVQEGIRQVYDAQRRGYSMLRG